MEKVTAKQKGSEVKSTEQKKAEENKEEIRRKEKEQPRKIGEWKKISLKCID
jgi:hypothetical protein